MENLLTDQWQRGRDINSLISEEMKRCRRQRARWFMPIRNRSPTNCTIVKAGGIFLQPRIFPSYFMNIVWQIFRENVRRSISWRLPKSTSNFSKFWHSVLYDEIFRDLLGILSADSHLPISYCWTLSEFSIMVKVVASLWKGRRVEFPF
jgi:hypothetical protein